MRILLLTTYFQPDLASTGVLMTQLAEDLAGLGHEISVLTSMPHYSTSRIWDAYRGKIMRRERREGLDIYRLYLYVPGEKTSFKGRALNYASFGALAGAMGILTGLPDVILVPSPPLTNGLVGDFLARLWRVPFVYNVQDVWPQVVIRAGVMRGDRIIRFSKWLERYVYRRAHRLSVISNGFKENLLAKGVPPEKIEVIPNFFDTEFVRPGPRNNGFRHDHDLQEEAFVVLFGGNVGHSQGLETVLDVAKGLESHPDIRFLIVGNGVAKGDLQEYAAELGLSNTTFLPFQPHEQLPEMYAAADLCLVPLKHGFTQESVPCKIYTIMASGRPMLASIDEGSDTWRLIEETGAGIAVPPEDPEALAQGVLRFYRDRDLGRRMGQAGREYVVEHNSRKVIARKYHELLTSVAG